MKACLYLLGIINITCQCLVCDTWKRIAILLLLSRCRIVQIGVKDPPLANPESFWVTQVVRIICSNLSWKDKLPKWKVFSFFCLLSFKWVFFSFEPEFCQLRWDIQIIYLWETMNISLMSGHQIEVSGRSRLSGD